MSEVTGKKAVTPAANRVRRSQSHRHHPLMKGHCISEENVGAGGCKIKEENHKRCGIRERERGMNRRMGMCREFDTAGESEVGPRPDSHSQPCQVYQI